MTTADTHLPIHKMIRY